MGTSAKEVKGTRNNKKGRFNDAKFVQYELTPSEKEACKVWATGFDELDTCMLNLADEGYRIAVKFDDYSHAYSAFVQIFEPDHAHYNCILTGRGSTPLKAIKQACFKHFVVFDQEWGTWLERRESSEIDD